MGYASTIRDTPGEAMATEARMAEADRARYDKALFGDSGQTERLALSNGAVAERSKTGCVAEADRAVFGSVRNALHVWEFKNEINAQATRLEAGLKRVLTTNVEKYNVCMADAGYPVSGLNADELAKQRFGIYRGPGVPPSSDEQSMAVADFRCQQRAGLVAAVNEEFLSKSGEWAAANQAAIMANYETLTASVERARKILATP